VKNLGDGVKASPLPKAKMVPKYSRRRGTHGGKKWVVEDLHNYKEPDPRAMAADWSAPLLLALMTVLGALQLLDALDVVYYPMIHGATTTMRFDLGLSLVLPLLFLLLIWLGWVIWKRRFSALTFPVIAICLYPFMSVETIFSIGSLLAVSGGLWTHRGIGRYFSGVLVLLGSIEVLALLHWVVFLPIGLSIPFRARASRWATEAPLL